MGLPADLGSNLGPAQCFLCADHRERTNHFIIKAVVGDRNSGRSKNRIIKIDIAMCYGDTF